tara:strand:+ start:174 stop:587 length:414 start_codon:yes stop_codon:yes gene_type:complete
MGILNIDFEHHVVSSMEDFTKITKGYCLYIISEPGMSWGIYGITSCIQIRFCQYLMKESEAVIWKEGVHLYLWKGNKKTMRNLETRIKRTLREQNVYEDIKTVNERGNQVEFFPNEYLRFMGSLVNHTIKTFSSTYK